MLEGFTAIIIACNLRDETFKIKINNNWTIVLHNFIMSRGSELQQGNAIQFQHTRFQAGSVLFVPLDSITQLVLFSWRYRISFEQQLNEISCSSRCTIIIYNKNQSALEIGGLDSGRCSTFIRTATLRASRSVCAGNVKHQHRSS